LAATAAPPVAAAIRASKNGVRRLPVAPAASAATSASAITRSIAATSSAAAAGIGLATSTPPWARSSQRTRQIAASSSTCVAWCSSVRPLARV
jgi:hypothetical protein